MVVWVPFFHSSRSRETELENWIEQEQMEMKIWQEIKDGWTPNPKLKYSVDIENEAMMKKYSFEICDKHINESMEKIKRYKQELKNKGVPVDE